MSTSTVEKIFTKEDFLKNSHREKLRELYPNRAPVKGVLTKEEMQEEVELGKTITVFTNVDDDSYFFSDDYCIGVRYLPKSYVPASIGIPHKVVARESLPSGWVNNVDDYITIYHTEGKYLSTVDELIDHLNENFAYAEIKD